MANSGDMDSAIVQRLQGDAELKALMPDGVFFEAAPAGAKRFVLVDLFDATDDDEFGRRAIESVLYAVQAIALSSAVNNGDMKAAAQRIDVLLSDPPPLAVPGFAYMATYRDEPGRIRFTEVDKVDASIRWFHRGGHYRLDCAPLV